MCWIPISPGVHVASGTVGPRLPKRWVRPLRGGTSCASTPGEMLMKTASLDEVEERRDVPVGELDELVRHAWRL